VELDSVLREFRQHAVYHSLQWHITPSWSEPLLSALRLLDSPGFCYRATLVVSSSDTDVEADGRQCTLREFFRLDLLATTKVGLGFLVKILMVNSKCKVGLSELLFEHGTSLEYDC